MARIHWARPDVIGAILSEARRPDAAEPVAIHVRPEIHALICEQARNGQNEPGAQCPGDRPWKGIRLVVDDRIPATPGYEIHRAAPRDRGPISDQACWSNTLSRPPRNTSAARAPQRTPGSLLHITRDRRSAVPERLAG